MGKKNKKITVPAVPAAAPAKPPATAPAKPPATATAPAKPLATAPKPPVPAKPPAAAKITIEKEPAKPQVKPQAKPPPFKKANIPRAVREQIWLRQFGKVYEGKCPTPWCQNVITVHDFQSGHNIPESKGGPTTAENLLPLCGRCNQSMGNHYTFDEWSLLGKEPMLPVQAQVQAPLKKPWYCWCLKV